MNFLLMVIAAIVVAINVGTMTAGIDGYSDLAYVLFLLLDFVVFSFFCIRKKTILVRPFVIFVGMNLAVAFYFLNHS